MDNSFDFFVTKYLLADISLPAFFCTMSSSACVALQPETLTLTYCLVLSYFSFVTKTWTDLVLLSKLARALGMK